MTKSKTPCCLIYITTPDDGTAETLGRMLVEERFAAAVNIVPGVTSFYHWQGAVREGRELLLVAKTKRSLADALIARVEGDHSYHCPGILVVPIEAGHEPYLAWLIAETRALSEPPET